MAVQNVKLLIHRGFSFDPKGCPPANPNPNLGRNPSAMTEKERKIPPNSVPPIAEMAGLVPTFSVEKDGNKKKSFSFFYFF
jgi:hypothetical protein